MLLAAFMGMLCGDGIMERFAVIMGMVASPCKRRQINVKAAMNRLSK